MAGLILGIVGHPANDCLWARRHSQLRTQGTAASGQSAWIDALAASCSGMQPRGEFGA